MERSFLFSSFKRKGCIEILKVKQWVKYKPRVYAKTALSWPQQPQTEGDQNFK